ncbi:hypothetical protein HHI36_011665 [Cryptolaemus montrouzieri]|uniref:Uncharacterized protein n=1 Tax=Cryptolaemus montrouzieri TaxID=559131 RepID=A0ABD2MMR7_9CUCU
MEVIKCGLCKAEIEYSQRCRVYIKTDEPRNSQRSSKRPHLGRFKLISTASSTEHISFTRRLKNLRKKSQILSDVENSDSNKEQDIERNSSEVEGSLNSGEEHIKAEDKPIEQPQKSEQKDSKSKDLKLDHKPSNKKRTSKKMSHPQFQSSFEEYIKPIISKTTAAKISKTKSSDSSSDLEVNRKGSGNTYKSVKNGNVRNSLREFETYYWLDMPKPKSFESKKLGYQFENLVTEVKHMKLPSSEWKIKIMVHKQEMVSVSFSNKQIPEKVVSINAKNSVCDISIDNKN